MISLNEFTKITNEVITSIEKSLYYLFTNYPEDYVLFLASGEYDETLTYNKKLNLMPYMISGHNLDYFFEYTRLDFLSGFLNRYYTFEDENVLLDDSYRLNIEFLIYIHIWEAKPFLKKIYRLANLLNGKEYDWKVSIPNYNKSKFIRNNIIEPLNSFDNPLSQILIRTYNSDLRNAIAHSDYQLDDDLKTISFKSKSRFCNISYDEWSIKFTYSVCFSYYFIHIVTGRRKRIIEDWGRNYFTIKVPFSDGTIKHAAIEYEKDRDAFSFIKKNNN